MQHVRLETADAVGELRQPQAGLLDGPELVVREVERRHCGVVGFFGGVFWVFFWVVLFGVSFSRTSVTASPRVDDNK